jgi:EmrB/QacA subfamily drug resistance transporter
LHAGYWGIKMIRIMRELGSRDDRRRWMALLVVCFGQLMIVLDSTIVNVALPTIQRDLGFGEADLTWVVNAYGIAYAGFVLLAGRLGDLVGRKRVFLAGIGVFTAASVLCGLAPNPTLLVAARFAQGIGGAFSAGVVMAIIVTSFRGPRERAQAMSLFAFTIAGGGSLGLLAGGLLTQAASWHWVFFINLPIGVLTLISGLRLIEEDPGLGLRSGLDLGGSVLVTAGLMVGVYTIVTAGANGWASAHTVGFGLAATGLLISFFLVQARRRHPILPLRILRIRSLTGANLARGLLATGMFTTFFLGALYLQRVRGLTPFQTGLAFLPFTLALGGLSLGATVRLVGRFGSRRVLVAGLGLVAGALFLHSTAGPGTDYFPQLFLTYGLFGLGAGLSVMPLTLIAMSEVPAEDAGLAAGISNVALQVGAALGLAVLGTVASERTRALAGSGLPAPGALAGGYELAFLVASAIVVAALGVVLLGLRSPRPLVTLAAAAGEASSLEQAA